MEERKGIGLTEWGDIDFSLDAYWRAVITPEIALEIYERNVKNNRQLKRRREEYMRDMNRGHWVVGTGETIKFDIDGNFFDGQNRIWAVIATGVPTVLDIKTGAPREAMEVVDSNIQRTDGDAVKIILDVPNSKIVSALANKAQLLHNGANCIGTHVGVNVKPTRQEVIRFVAANNDILQELVRDATRAMNAVKVKGMGQTGWFICHWLTSTMDRDKGDEFYELVVNNEGAAVPFVADAVLRDEYGRSKGRDWVCYKYIENFDRIMMGNGRRLGSTSEEVVKAYLKVFEQYLDNMRVHDTTFEWAV